MKTNFVNPKTNQREVGIIEGEYVINAKGEKFHRNTIKNNVELGRKKGTSFLSKLINNKF